MEVTTTYDLPPGVNSLEQFVFLEDRLQAGRYLTLAIFTILIFEYISTFDNEVKYIWRSKPLFAWTKLLFVIVRYVPLMTSFVRLYVVLNPVLEPSVCFKGIAFTAWAGIFATAAVEMILMLRVWALYSCSRAVLIFFFAIASCGIAGALVILQVNPKEVPSFIATVAPPQMTTCMHGNPVQHPLLFTMLACIELCIFLMLVRRAAFAVIGPNRAAPILTVLVKDGVVYFVFVFLSLILAAVSPFIQYLAQPVMDSELTVGFSAIACVRLIFSLRGAQLHDQEEDEEEEGEEGRSLRRPSASIGFSRSGTSSFHCGGEYGGPIDFLGQQHPDPNDHLTPLPPRIARPRRDRLSDLNV
jgi:hypothetical protein